MCEPGGEFGGIIGTEHAIASVKVDFEEVLVEDVFLDSLETGCFTAVECHDAPWVGVVGVLDFFVGVAEIGQGWHVSERTVGNGVGRNALEDGHDGLILWHGKFGLGWYW